MALAAPALARADVTPPVLAGFTFSPASIDTSDDPAAVLVTFHATDDSSGVASVRATFSNRDVISEPRGCESLAPDSGTAQDGVFTCTVNFPQYSEPGTWQVFTVELVDAADNQALLFTSTLTSLGFPTDLEVITQPDTMEPVLAGFNFLPQAVDASSSAATVHVTFHATDERSGVAWAKVTFQGPGSPGASQSCTVQAVTPGGEPALDVVLSCDVVLPQFSAPGIWAVFGVDVADVAGNLASYSTSGLLSLGFPTQLLVTSQPDTTPPALNSFAFTPAAIDASGGSAAVQVTLVASDDLSGVASVSALFSSPGTPAVTQECTSSFPDSGSSLAGTYHCTIPFPQGSPEGVWKASQVEVRDAVNNFRLYGTAELAQAGFPVNLAVGFAPGAPRAAVVVPGAGRSVRGDSVTVAARLVQGNPGGVSPSAGVRLDFRALPLGTFAPIPPRDPDQPNPDATYPYLIHWDVTGRPDGNYELRAVAHDSAGNPDPAPASIAITIANGSAVVDDHVNAQGRQECRTAVDGQAEDLAASGGRGPRGALAEIDLPAGSLSLPSDAIKILYPDPAGELSHLEQPEQSTGIFVDLSLESGQGTLAQGLAASLDLHFADANQDGVVDGTSIREEDLELRRLDTTSGAYVKFSPWTVLTSHNEVRGVTTQMGRFALTGSLEPSIAFQVGGTILSWGVVGEALSYNVYRGGLSQLRDTNGDGLPDGGYGDCRNAFDPNLTDTIFSDTEAPAAPGTGFFYLVSFMGAQGEKGLGNTSGGLHRVAAAPCP